MIEDLLTQLFSEGYIVSRIEPRQGKIAVTIERNGVDYTGNDVSFEKALVSAMLWADMAGE